MKVCEDKKTKFVESKTINTEMIQKTSINFITKELLKFIDDSYPEENFLNFENYKPKQINITSPIPKRYPTNKSTIRLGKGRTPTKRKKLTFIEKMTMTPYMYKEGVKPISILEKDEFFEVRKKEKNKDIKTRMSRRRSGVVDPNKLKSLSHKPLEYINALKRFRNKTDYFEGVITGLERRHIETTAEWIREWIEGFMISSECPLCHGSRLKDEVLTVKVGKKNIWEVTNMSIKELIEFFNNLKLNKTQQEIICWFAGT